MKDQSDLFEYAPNHDSEKQVVKPAGHLKIEDPTEEPSYPDIPNDRVATDEEMQQSNQWYRWMRNQPDPTEGEKDANA